MENRPYAFRTLPPLTPEEQKEADELLSELISRVDKHGPLSRYIRGFRDDRNIELMRSMNKLLTRDDTDLFLTIHLCNDIIGEHTDYPPSQFITAEMLEIHARVYTAFTDLPEFFPTTKIEEFCAYTFLRMSRAEDIMFMLEKRGIVDTEEITKQADDLHVGTYEKALQDGIL